MDIAEVQARPREARGSRACRRLRRQGLVPAVLYGRGEPNLLLTVRQHDLEHLLAERAFIVMVNWDGQQETAQLKDIQYDALGDTVVHADFVRISLTESVVVSVPVETHGEARGVTEGGVLDLREHTLEVECLPSAIPENIRVEIAELEIGDDLRISDIAFPEGVAPVAEPDAVVVVISPPAEVEEEEVEGIPEELVAEPEVIGREAPEEAEEQIEEEEPE
jgi:large subunit ribosomal protein L25